jgi:hypothetical protein
MTEHPEPTGAHNGDATKKPAQAVWVGDLVFDPVANRHASVLDVTSDGTYFLRAPQGPAQWIAKDPDRLEIVTKRTDRDWSS